MHTHIPVSVKKHSFSVSLGHATQQHKLQSSRRYGALTYFYFPKSARAYFFPNPSKFTTCSGSISVDPICRLLVPQFCTARREDPTNIQVRPADCNHCNYESCPKLWSALRCQPMLRLSQNS